MRTHPYMYYIHSLLLLLLFDSSPTSTARSFRKKKIDNQSTNIIALKQLLPKMTQKKEERKTVNLCLKIYEISMKKKT